MDRVEARRIIEALLFTSEKPITVDQIKEVLDEIDSKDNKAIML